MSFALDKYFARIGYLGPTRVSQETLWGIHVAQGLAIPFENLDIHLGKPIRIDRECLVEKLLSKARGGYCYEVNGLLRAALSELGFSVETLAARNLQAGPPWRQKSHMLLRVWVDGGPWLADLGFGGTTLREPIPFETGTEFAQGFERIRVLEHEEFGFVLQSFHDDAWRDLYGFTSEVYQPLDFEMMNHFNSTHPSSSFLRQRMAARITPTGRVSLAGTELKTRSAAGVSVRAVSEGTYRDVLDQVFGIRLPAGAEFIDPLQGSGFGESR